MSGWRLGSWRDVVGADLRSLALLRVLLAASVLVDLVVRAGDLRDFYSDAGILPRAALLEQFAWLHEMPPCVHLIGGAVWVQVLIFALHALAAVSMLVGYRTRLATFAVWLLTSSVQLRNLYVGAGADALLRMLLLWGIFLPLGELWSVDARQREDAPAKMREVSFATLALVVQVGILYGAAGLAKLEVPSWRDGTALAWILEDDVRVTTLGSWLAGSPALVALLDRAVLLVEIAGPVLLLVPLAFGVLRTAVVAAFVTMNLGFLAALAVGLFPWIATVGALGLLPGWFWDRVLPQAGWRHDAGGAAATLARWLPPARRGPAEWGRARRIAGQAVCLLLLVFVLAWNVAVARDPGFRPAGSIEWLGRSLFLQQAWRMFARPATRTGWISIDGRLRDGRSVELMASGGPVPDLERAIAAVGVRPQPISSQYRNAQWKNFLSRAVRGTNTAPQLQLYGRHLCRQWNAGHSGSEQLSTFQLLWYGRDVPAPGGERTYRPVVVWSHDCFG